MGGGELATHLIFCMKNKPTRLNITRTYTMSFKWASAIIAST